MLIRPYYPSRILSAAQRRSGAVHKKIVYLAIRSQSPQPRIMSIKNPFSFQNITQAIDDFFSGKSNINETSYTGGNAHASPFANVSEVEGGVLLQLAAPGLSKDAFSISLEKDNLTVETKGDVKTEQKIVKVRRQEFDYSTFHRVFRLDSKMFELAAITSRYEDGVLHIFLPFNTKPAEEKIRINIL